MPTSYSNLHAYKISRISDISKLYLIVAIVKTLIGILVYFPTLEQSEGNIWSINVYTVQLHSTMIA